MARDETSITIDPAHLRAIVLDLATLCALVSRCGGCHTVTSQPGDTTFEILQPATR